MYPNFHWFLTNRMQSRREKTFTYIEEIYLF